MGSTLKVQLVDLFQRLGITANYTGYWYLLLAVQIAYENQFGAFHITKDVYPVVARMYQTTPQNVEHDMRTAIERCWEKGNRAYLCEICFFTERPSNRDFITMIASYLYRQHQPAR